VSALGSSYAAGSGITGPSVHAGSPATHFNSHTGHCCCPQLPALLAEAARCPQCYAAFEPQLMCVALSVSVFHTHNCCSVVLQPPSTLFQARHDMLHTPGFSVCQGHKQYQRQCPVCSNNRLIVTLKVPKGSMISLQSRFCKWVDYATLLPASAPYAYKPPPELIIQHCAAACILTMLRRIVCNHIMDPMA
jgi:hypothetical protein